MSLSERFVPVIDEASRMTLTRWLVLGMALFAAGCSSTPGSSFRLSDLVGESKSTVSSKAVADDPFPTAAEVGLAP